MDAKRDQILDVIDDYTVDLPWEKAVAFLEELSADLDGRIEALREENS